MSSLNLVKTALTRASSVVPRTSSSPRILLSRNLRTCAVALQQQKARKAEADEPRSVKSGKPLADSAVKVEARTSGLPKEREAIEAPLAKISTPDLFSLGSRTIIVTGGARGLGFTLAESLLESGAHVRAVDILPEPVEPAWSSALELAKSRNLTLTYTRLDVTDPEAVSSTFSEIFASAPEAAPIRGIFVAAGIQLLKKAEEISAAEFRKVIDVNLTGTFLVVQSFGREWFKRNQGADGSAGGNGASVVMTGSMSGHIANFGMEIAAYNSSKAGVNHLAKSLAVEWSKRGIRVNTISPGYIKTAMTAALLEDQPHLDEIWHATALLGRLCTVDELRGPVTFLLSDASSFMTGADILVDGGHTAT